MCCVCLFEQFVCCRDLKAANVLLSSSNIEDGEAKVADFGCSKVMSTLRSTHTGRTGTHAFNSPETFVGEYSEASDIYAFAMLIYEVITREAPWQGVTEAEITAKVMQRFDEEDPNVKLLQGYGMSIEDQKKKWIENHPLRSRRPDLKWVEDGCLDALQDLITECWADNPGERPTFAKCCELLEDLLKELNTAVNPKTRSESLGVCADYICTELFMTEVSEAATKAVELQEEEKIATGHAPKYPVDERNPSFLDIAPDGVMKTVFTDGDHPIFRKGFGKTCPRDGDENCSIVDALDQQGGGEAGSATHFLSWVATTMPQFRNDRLWWQSWQYKVPTFRRTIQEWRGSSQDVGAAAEAESMHAGSRVYLWVVTVAACAVLSLSWCGCLKCFFWINQYRLQANDVDLMIVFKARLKGIGKLVAMMSRWRKPQYLTRSWCKC